MSFEWKNYIRNNLPDLLKDIDTCNGLENEIRQSTVLPAMAVTRIWGIKDEIRRISELLDQIQKGDTERYKKFCDALIANNQKHIVDLYLTKCIPKDSTDSATNQLEHPLSEQVQRKLYDRWNDLIEKLESSVEFLSELTRSKVFTDLQIRRLKGLEFEIQRNEQILRYLEKTSQEKFQRFCDALHSTNQGHLVTFFFDSPSEGSRAVNEVVEQTAKLTVEEVTPHASRALQPECSSSVGRPACTTTSQPVIASNIYHPDPDDAAVLKSAYSLCPSVQLRYTSLRANGEGDQQTSDPQHDTSMGQQPEQLCRPCPDMIQEWREEVKSQVAYDIFYDESSPKKRGVAIIVANTEFSRSATPLESRTGTNVDIEMLQELLAFLMFEVHLHTNLTEQQILEECRKESNTMWCEATVFCFFIMSHGVADAVFGVDGKLVKIEDLVTIFDGNNCSKLVGKPKIFFIQACQGTSKTMGVDMSDSGAHQTDESDCENVRHEKADIMQVFSSYPGFVSFRNTTTGSYFIQFIHEVFMKNAHEKHVSDMINVVAQKVNAAQMDGVYKQTCLVKSSTDKHIYLFPY